MAATGHVQVDETVGAGEKRGGALLVVVVAGALGGISPVMNRPRMQSARETITACSEMSMNSTAAGVQRP